MRIHRLVGGLSVLLLVASFALLLWVWLIVALADRFQSETTVYRSDFPNHLSSISQNQPSAPLPVAVADQPQPLAAAQGQPIALTSPISDGLEADLGFRPSLHGFGFANYGLTQSKVDNLPSSAAAIELLGATTVCKRGTVSTDGTSCELDAHVVELVAAVTGMTYGQAYGMAGTALRFFLGKESPDDIIPGAPESVPALDLSTAIKEHIGRYTLQEGTAPKEGDHGWVRKLTARQILEEISTELSNGLTGDPYLLMLYSKNGTSSHALIPYRIVNTATDQYDLYIYDSNFPLDDNRRIRFDLSTGGWSYSTTLPESGQVIDFSGSESTSLVDLRRLSAHLVSGLKIIGAQENTSQAAGLFETGEPVGFFTKNCFTVQGAAQFDNAPDGNGQCNKLPVEGSVQCLGGSDGQAAEEGGRRVNRVCGTKPDLAANMIFTLYSEPGAEKALTLLTNAGNVVRLGTDAALLTASHARHALTDTLELAITPDAKTLTITATQSTQPLPPVVFVVRGATEAQPSYTVEISHVQLAAGRLITVTTDVGTGRLSISDNDSDQVRYAVGITRQPPTGAKQLYQHKNFALAGVAAYADFGHWDGVGAMNFVVDDEGDGFADDQPIALINQANDLYLPVVAR